MAVSQTGMDNRVVEGVRAGLQSEQSRAEQNRAEEQSRTGQSRAEQNRAEEQRRTEQSRAEQKIGRAHV